MLQNVPTQNQFENDKIAGFFTFQVFNVTIKNIAMFQLKITQTSQYFQESFAK